MKPGETSQTNSLIWTNMFAILATYKHMQIREQTFMS